MTETFATPTVNGQSEFIWYYHPDHLGSTGFVTDQNGELYEHVEYFPFGETWVQEHSNTQRTPYLYTGKELDEETGLYYFGARYYDPRTSVWQSADPILGTYLDGKRGMGGVYTALNLGMYGYAHLNPLVLVDPDGNSPETALKLISQHRGTINKYARQHGVSAQAVASIIFQEKYHGAFADFKNIPAVVDARTGASDKADKRSFGLAEMQVRRAAELLGHDLSDAEQRQETLSSLSNPESAIDLIARNIAAYQSETGRPLSVEEATVAHNAGSKGLESFTKGEVTDTGGKVYSRSWNHQKAIAGALKGKVDARAVPDNPPRSRAPSGGSVGGIEAPMP